MGKKERIQKRQLLLQSNQQLDKSKVEEDVDKVPELVDEDGQDHSAGGNSDDALYNSMLPWSRLGVPPLILKALRDLNFDEPTPIQVAAIPAVIRDRLDVLGAAATGSGKTLAFGIPLINYVINDKKTDSSKRLRGLVLTPTRELAVQIKQHMDQVAKYANVSIACLVGGLALVKQERILNKFRPDIIVATPGRLWELIESSTQDHLTRQTIATLRLLVIDEADRMTEKGHFEELTKVIDIMKQTDYDAEHNSNDNEAATTDAGGGDDEEPAFVDVISEREIFEGIEIEEISAEDYYKEKEQKKNRRKRARRQRQEESDEEEPTIDVDSDSVEENEPAVIYEDDDDVDSLHSASDEGADSDAEMDGSKFDDESAPTKVPEIKQRQILVFSATLTLVHDLPKRFQVKKKRSTRPSVQGKLRNLIEMLGMRMEKSKVIDLTSKGIGRPDQDQLKESCIVCAKDEKDLYLYYFLALFPGRSIVFCNSKDCIRRLMSVLKLLGLAPRALHADLDQRARLQALEKFTSIPGQGLLIASDVAARGLDINNVDHVIHYQCPRTSESYVHRSGRTARANSKGVTLVLVDPSEGSAYSKLCRSVNEGNHLDTFPIDDQALKLIKARVQLAQAVDVLEHRLNKIKLKSDWFRRAAKEMDIDVDGRDDLFEERQESDRITQDRLQLKSMKKSLASMLKQPLAANSKQMLTELIKSGSHSADVDDNAAGQSLIGARSALEALDAKRSKQPRKLELPTKPLKRRKEKKPKWAKKRKRL